MSAVLSPCLNYRYALERMVRPDGPSRTIFGEGPLYAFFGVNPSTADADVDDATVRKWIGFVKAWGGTRFIVGNVFAFRSTDVRALARATDPVGPFNQAHLKQIITDADVLVPCWGSTEKLPRPLRSACKELMEQLLSSGKPVKSFGLTKSGDPMHPLMLSYDTQMIHLNQA